MHAQDVRGRLFSSNGVEAFCQRTRSWSPPSLGLPSSVTAPSLLLMRRKDILQSNRKECEKVELVNVAERGESERARVERSVLSGFP